MLASLGPRGPSAIREALDFGAVAVDERSRFFLNPEMITRRKRRPRFGGERAHQNVGDDLLCAKLLGERHVVRRHEHGAVVGDAHEGHAREGHHVERHQAAAAGPDREKALGAPVADRRENGVFGHVGAAGTVGQRGAHAGLDPEEEFGDSGSVAQPVSMSAAANAARPLKEADVIVDAPPCMCSVL